MTICLALNAFASNKFLRGLSLSVNVVCPIPLLLLKSNEKGFYSIAPALQGFVFICILPEHEFGRFRS